MKMLRMLSMIVVAACAFLWTGRLATAQTDDHPPAEADADDFAAGDVVHPDGHTEGDLTAGPPQPLSVDPDLAIWTWAVFLLLLLVLAKFAWKPIVAALDERENNIAKNIEDAARQNEDARQLLAEYDRRLAAAQDQVRAILDDARRSAEQSQQEILAKGRAEAEAEMNRAKREIETATSVALKELAERSTDLAIELAGKIVRKELSAKDHAQMIQEAVGRFPDAGPSRN